MINELISPFRLITTRLSLSVCRSSELGVLFLFSSKIFTQKLDCIFLNKQRLFRYFHPIPRNVHSTYAQFCTFRYLLLILLGQCYIKGRYQGLGQPERKDQLRSSHEELSEYQHLQTKFQHKSTYLWYQALEEGREALVPDHAAHNPEATLWVVEVSILDTGLNNIQRSGDNQRRGGTGNGRNKILHPSGLVIILKSVQVTFRECRATEELCSYQLCVHD